MHQATYINETNTNTHNHTKNSMCNQTSTNIISWLRATVSHMCTQYTSLVTSVDDGGKVTFTLSDGVCVDGWVKERPVNHLLKSLVIMTAVLNKWLVSLARVQWMKWNLLVCNTSVFLWVSLARIKHFQKPHCIAYINSGIFHSGGVIKRLQKGMSTN